MPPKSRRRHFGVREMLDKKHPHSVIVPCRSPGVIPSGVDTIDLALGVGGLPEARFIIAHGPSSSGKTTWILTIASIVQALGGLVLYCDFESKLALPWAKVVGVDVEDEDSFILRNPRYIEEMFELFDDATAMVRAVDTKVPILLVIDSLQDALARISFEKTDFNPTGFSPESRVWSYVAKKFKGICRQRVATMIGISQLRADPNDPRATKVGVGNEMVHSASIVVQFRTQRERGGIGGSEFEDGNVVVTKNQVAAPWGTGNYRIRRNQGIDLTHATITAASELGLLEQSGSWFKVDIGEAKPIKIQGLENLMGLAEQKPDVFARIKKAVRSRIEGGS